MFEEKVEKPRTTSLRPLNYKDVLLKEFSKTVQENYTKNSQILREYKEYIKYLEQELEKSRDLEGQANNQASYEYILKCEAEKLLEEKQKQIVALKSQLDSQQSNLPEVPQFVADEIYFRRYVSSSSGIKPSDGLLLMEVFRDLNSFHGICRDGNNFKEGKFYHWMQSSENNKTFVEAILNGYTIAKEKRFYLKNKLTGLYLCESKKGFFEQENPTLELTSRCDFSQQEIDSMETGSYEQIEVEE
ncbi:DUF1642 domain-containing protein [Lactococcus garvieae]|uniref:DUF1642 domain-containing protein n=1 Tax=Lactococcus garvieae TaxID=1363 RepID=UPI003D772020